MSKNENGVYLGHQAGILDEPFHACAFAAFVQIARAHGRWPDSEPVRQLAYQLYEQHLAEKNAAKQPTRKEFA